MDIVNGTKGSKFYFYSDVLFSGVKVYIAFIILSFLSLIIFRFSSVIYSEFFYWVFSVGLIISDYYLFAVFLIWSYFLGEIAFKESNGVSQTPFVLIGWFFVPVFNLFKPYIIFKNIFITVSDSRLAPYSYSFIKVWWLFFIVSSVFTKVFFFYSFSVISVNSFENSLYLNYIYLLLNFIYGLSLHKFVIKFVKCINTLDDIRQKETL